MRALACLALSFLVACSGISQGGALSGDGGAAGAQVSVGGAGSGGRTAPTNAGRGGSSAQAGFAAGGSAGATPAEAGHAGESTAEAGQGGIGGDSATPIIKILSPIDGQKLLTADFPFSPVLCTNVDYYVAIFAGHPLSPPTGAIHGPCATAEFGFQYSDATITTDLTPDSLESSSGELSAASRLTAEMWNSLSNHSVVAADSVSVWVDHSTPALSLIGDSQCGTTISYAGASAWFRIGCDYPVTVKTIDVFNNSVLVDSVVPGSQTKSFPLVLGENVITAAAPEPSGNIGHLPGACVITVNP